MTSLNGNLKHGTLMIVKSLLILALASFLTLPVYAENWTTTDGKVYEDVKVIRVQDDAITILFKDGGALIPIFKLPPTLQKKYSYDPVKAKAAADLRAKEDAENAKQLQAEIDQASKMKTAQQIQEANQVNQARAATADQTKP